MTFSWTTFLALALTAWLLSKPVPMVFSRDGSGPDALLDLYPFSGRFQLSTGEAVPVPFHAFDAHSTIVYGSADLETARHLVREGSSGELHPVETSDGRALGSMWMMMYASTGIGPYNELVSGLLVSRGSPVVLDCASTDLACGLSATLFRRDVMSFAARLWLDQPLPVAYGREILGTDKYLTPPMGVGFAEDGGVRLDVPGVASMSVRPQTRLGMVTGVVGPLLLSAGPRNVLGLLGEELLQLPVVCPKGVATGYEHHSPMWNAVMAVDPTDLLLNAWTGEDAFEIDAADNEHTRFLRALGFEGAVALRMEHGRIVLTGPHNGGHGPHS